MKEFPPFRLDTANQCLWRSGTPGDEKRVLLTPKAFAVLRHLVEHAGRLVSQGELLDAAWHDAHVEPAVLNNQILHLRQALGDRPRDPLFIETLSRRGYRFIARVQETVSEVDRMLEPPSGKLIGRQPQLVSLQEGMARVLKDFRQLVFVTGEAGIGKTALVDEFLRWARIGIPELRAVRGQCIEGYGGREPYYPVLEAVRQLCQGADGEPFVRILASHAPTWLVQFPALLNAEHRTTLQREIQGATRERMLREIGDALELAAGEKPLALVLEDVHWIDPATVDLISALGRRRTPARLMLICTFRPADTELSNSALRALVDDLLIHRLSSEIALDPLTQTETTQFVMGAAGRDEKRKALGTLLYRRSEGNPLFIVAALEDLSRRGLISRQNDGWEPAVPLAQIEVGVPENLRRMIEARIQRLSEQEQHLLEAASLHSAGRYRFGVATRAPLADMDTESFEAVCDGLARRHGIVRVSAPVEFPDGTASAAYEFVHELYREVCYRRLGPRRRVKLHRRLGEIVEARLGNDRERSALWLAANFEQGEDWLRAVRYLMRAANTARQRCAYAQELAILQRAASLVTKLSAEERPAAEAEVTAQIAIASEKRSHAKKEAKSR